MGRIGQLLVIFLNALENYKPFSPSTATVYAGVLNEFFKFLSNKPISTITYEDLVMYSEYLSRGNPARDPVFLAISTQNRKINTIKSFFKYAMKTGYIRFNPAEPLETQRVDSKVAQRIISIDELESLFEAAVQTSLFATIVVYWFASTGCRVSELVNAMWADVFQAPSGDICARIHGKGHKDRLIKIPFNLFDMIVRYRKEKGIEAEINPNSNSPILINKYGKKYTAQSIWSLIKKLKNKEGIVKEISPHFLRHTFATEVARDKNSNLWQLQYDLGHADISTTQGYVHIAQGMEETSVDHLAYMEKLDNILQKKQQ